MAPLQLLEVPRPGQAEASRVVSVAMPAVPGLWPPVVVLIESAPAMPLLVEWGRLRDEPALFEVGPPMPVAGLRVPPVGARLPRDRLFWEERRRRLLDHRTSQPPVSRR